MFNYFAAEFCDLFKCFTANMYLFSSRCIVALCTVKNDVDAYFNSLSSWVLLDYSLLQGTT